jgi:hypothetical protein
MALTKKQRMEITDRYKNTYRIVAKELHPEDLRAEFTAAFNELASIMKLLDFTSDDFIKMKNEVMEQYDQSLYFLYWELNQVMNEISGKEIIFEYEYKPKYIYHRIESYDFDVKRYGTLKNKMHEIERHLQECKAIKANLEKQIAGMIA